MRNGLTGFHEDTQVKSGKPERRSLRSSIQSKENPQRKKEKKAQSKRIPSAKSEKLKVSAKQSVEAMNKARRPRVKKVNTQNTKQRDFSTNNTQVTNQTPKQREFSSNNTNETNQRTGTTIKARERRNLKVKLTQGKTSILIQLKSKRTHSNS